MKIQITGGGIFVANGKGESEELAIGTELTVSKDPTGWAGRYSVLSGGNADKALVVNPAATPEGGAPYEARPKDGSAGWFQVYDSAGVAVGKAMREDDANAFNAMSDEEKAEFVKADV